MPFQKNESLRGGNAGGNDLVGNSFIGNYGQAAGGVPANFQEFYNQIKQQNESYAAPDEGTKELSLFDYMAKQARNASEAIRNIGGSQEAFERAEGVNKLLPFIGTLPTGILGAPGEAIASGYEAASGHNLDTANLQTGTISDKDLTTTQRIGALINAGIEGPMTLVGGSGRAVGAAANVLGKANPTIGRALNKIMPAEGMGLVNRVSREAGDSAGMAAAKQIGFDILEEGNEEFVQSFAEDMRDESELNVGKAFESAMWGALGGGIMSAGGIGISKAVEATNKATSPATDTNINRDGDPYAKQTMKFESGIDTRLTPWAQEYDKEQAFSDNKVPGGFSTVVIPGMRGQDINTSRVGVDDFKSMWDAQGKEGHEFWANKLNTTEEAITQALNAVDNDVQMNTLLAQAGGRVRVAIGRNPGTSKSSIFATDLAGFNKGSGMQLSALASQLSGGDIDGDTRFIIDDSETNALYPTELFLDPNNKGLEILEYMPYLNSDLGRQLIRNSIEKNLGGILNKNSDTATELVESLSRARYPKRDTGNRKNNAVAAAEVLGNLRAGVGNYIKPGTNGEVYSSAEVNNAISGFFSDIFENYNKDSEIYESVLADAIVEVKGLKDTMADMVLVEEDSEGKYIVSPGSAEAIQTMSDWADLMDFIMSPSRIRKDEAFRQQAAPKYQFAKKFETMSHLVESLGHYNESNIAKQMTIMMRLTDLGEDVSHVINGIFNVQVLTRVYRDLNLGTTASNRVGADVTFEQLTKSFEKHYNELRKPFNDALKTTDGVSILGSIEKRPISFNDSYGDASAVMYKAFQGAAFEEIFNINDDSEYRGMTVAEASKAVSESGVNRLAFSDITMANDNGKTAESIRNFLLNRTEESKKIENNVMSTMRDLPRISLNEAMKLENYGHVTYIIDSFARLVGPQVASEMMLRTVDSTLNGPWAEIILNGTEDERVNLAISMSLTYKYDTVLKLIQQQKDGSSHVDNDLIFQAATEVYDGSRLTRMIARQISEDGSSSFLESLIDVNKSLSEKRDAINNLQIHKGYGKEGFIVDCLNTNDSELGISSISQRITRVRNSARLANQYEAGHMKSQAKDLFRYIDNEMSDVDKNNIVMPKLREFFSYNRGSVNLKLVSGMLSDSIRYSLHDAEKGTVPFSSSAVFQQMHRHFNGGMYSFLHDITSVNLGKMSATEFAQNPLAIIDVLFNGKTIECTDSNSDGRIDAQRIMDDVFGKGAYTLKDGKLNYAQFKDLMLECPTLLSTIMGEVATVSAMEDPTVVIANENDPKKGFSDFINSLSDNNKTYQYKKEFDAVSWELMMDPSYYMVLASCIDLSKGTSPSAIQKQVDSLHTQMVNHVMAVANEIRKASEGNISDKEKVSIIRGIEQRMRSDMMSMAAEDLKDQMRECLSISKFASVNAMIKSVEIGNTILNPHLAELIVKKSKLADRVKKQLLNDPNIKSAKDRTIEQDVEEFGDAFSDEAYGSVEELLGGMVGGEETAQKMAIELMSLIGPEAWKKSLVDSWMDSIRTLENKEFFEDNAEQIRNDIAVSIDESFNEIMQHRIVSENKEILFRDQCFDKNGNLDTKTILEISKNIVNQYGDESHLSYNEIEEHLNDISEMFNDAKTEYERSEADRQLESLRVSIQNLALSSHLRSIGAYGNIGPNFDAYADADMLQSSIFNMASRIAADKDTFELAKAPTEIEKASMPQMYLGNTTNSYMSMNAMFHAVTGPIGTSVGTNGGVLNTFVGLASIPHNIECNEEGRVIKASEFRNKRSDFINRYIDLNGRRRYVSMSFRFDQIKDDDVIRVYDGKCGLGCCRKHSRYNGVPGFDTALDVLETISSVLDDSQEAANLKLKKSIKARDFITTKRKSEPEVRPKTVQYNNESPDVFAEMIINTVEEYRTGLAEHFMSELNSVYKDMVDIHDAQSLAEFMAYTISVEYVDEEGLTKRRLFTYDQFRSGETYTLPPELAGVSIISATPNLTSAQALNDKIAHDIANDRFYNEVDENGNPKTRSITTDVMKETASKSLQDWSKYNHDGLNIGNYLRANPGKKLAFPTQMIRTDEPSSRQKYLGMLGMRGGIDPDIAKQNLNNNTISLFNAKDMASASRDIVQDNRFIITRVDISTKGINEHYETLKLYESKWTHPAEANGKKDFKVSGYGAAYLSTMNQDEVNRLFENPNDSAWKYDYILVPTKSVSEEYKNYIDNVFNVDGVSFSCINAADAGYRNYATGQTPQYSIQTERLEDIFIFAGDESGRLHLGDSAALMADSAVKNRKFDFDKPVKIKLNNLTSNNIRSICGATKIAEYYEQLKLDKNKRNVELFVDDIDGIHKDEARRKTLEFMRQVSENPSILNTGGYKDCSIGMGECFAIVEQAAADGKTRIQPLFITGALPKVIDEIYGIEIQGDEVTVTQHTEVTWNQYSTWKIQFYNQAMKMEARVATTDEMADMPVPFGMGEGFGNYGTYDAKSQQGRLVSRGKQVFENECWYRSRLLNSSLRGTHNENIIDSYWTDPVSPTDARRRIDVLFDSNGNHSLWNQIANGSHPMFKPGNKNLNSAVQKLAVQAMGGNGVILPTLLESADPKTGTHKPVGYPEILGILSVLSQDEAAALFHAMNPVICSGNSNDPNGEKMAEGPLVRYDGTCLFDIGNGKSAYLPSYSGQHGTSNNFSNFGQGSGEAAYGKQHMIKNALRHGMRDQDQDKFIDAILAYSGKDVVWNASDNQEFEKMIQDGTLFDYATILDFSMDEADIGVGHTFAKQMLFKAIDDMAKTYNRVRIEVTKDGERIDHLKDDTFKTQVWERMNKAFGTTLNDIELFAIIKNKLGWSLNDGEGDLRITIERITNAVDDIIADINRGDYFLQASKIDNRVCIPLVPKDIMLGIYNRSEILRQKYSTYEDLVKAAEEQFEATHEYIENIQFIDKGLAGISLQKKKNALRIMLAYCQESNGLQMDQNLLLGNASLGDFRECYNTILAAAMPQATQEDLARFKQQQKEATEASNALREYLNSKRMTPIMSRLAQAGYVNTVKNAEPTMVTKAARNMESAVRLMSMASPILLPASNLIDTGVHTVTLKMALGLPFGPYNHKSCIDSEIAFNASRNDRAVKFFRALQQAQLLGMEEEFIIGFQDAEDKDAFIKEIYSGRSRFQKISDGVMRYASMNDAFTKQQLEICLEMAGILFEAEGIIEQTSEIDAGDGKTVTNMERMVTNDPTQWMIDCLMANSASREVFLRAMNKSMQTSMGRENAVSMLTKQLFEKVPVVSFMSAACVSPFYRYITNNAGRVLNCIMPTSTMHYVLVEKLKENPDLKAIGIERTNEYVDLKSAMIADAMHMTIPALAMLIGVGLVTAMGAALEPPEDDDKVLDYREWTFFGLRIAPEWWITDVLGPALPLACFMRTVINQKPRPEVLINGLGTVLSNNPLMKVSDVVDMLAEPDMFFEGWQEEADRYKWAPGEAPTPADKALWTAGQCGLNIIGRMITPSCLKTLQQSMQKYEKSYKRVYADDVTGIDAENEQTADTKRVSYGEAMIRQCTRRNPVLGFLMDVVHGGNTSYMSLGNPLLNKQGMPNVVYNEPIQQFYKDKYSIYTTDEKGNQIEKSEAEKQQVAFDVIATLESYDDMGALREQGFYIDSATKMYVSDIIWQIVNEKNRIFYDWYNSAESDCYVLGGGDYWTGREYRQEAYNAHTDDVNYLKQTLYYDKLWSQEMKEPMQQYFRENTTYAVDNNGEAYASGFPYTSSISPFKIAPGTTTDPQGTMGREEDWATPSAVTRETTGQRALVAITESDYIDTPSFDDWAKMHEDDSSSGTGNNKNGSNGTDSYGSGGTGSRATSYRSSGGGYSRRGSGGGGGGGGSSSPNLYSRVPNLNVNTPKTSNSSRLYDTNFDYLRPSFETKGSREANKRGDI